MSLSGDPIERLGPKLDVMNELLSHRGPDDQGIWCDDLGHAGLASRRLSIMDLTPTGAQPMAGPNGAVIVHNGEVYNAPELRDALAGKWSFKGTSDTESILAAYSAHGEGLVDHLRGMFAFAIWDDKRQRLVVARDRFGIKPLYYTIAGDLFCFASEAKALLPFLAAIETDADALAQYLTFQYELDDFTLFKGIKKLLPGHMLTLTRGDLQIRRYWDVDYRIDWEHSSSYFEAHLHELVEESVGLHLRSDVPVGSYMSGGIDSSLIAIIASRQSSENRQFFHGKFTQFPGYDESHYAEQTAQFAKGQLIQTEINAADFRDNIEQVIYHLDYPIAGPGAFAQYMVSALASQYVKVVFGGQGGDEIFGGYARYLLAYFEQCIKAALDGSYKNGNYVVTIESIIPNLGVLKEYGPLIEKQWRHGLFGDLDERYFHLIDRSGDITEEVDWNSLDKAGVYERFQGIFNSEDNVRGSAFFDKMTHFDFKCLLPALLHVEDRMSMAHGLESRVPFIDHPIVDFAAKVPADVKFKDGHLKHLLKTAFDDTLPEAISNRRDKMGFPVPLKEWFTGELKDFMGDVFTSQCAGSRPHMRNDKVLEGLSDEAPFSRKTWGLLSLELWQRNFHDRAHEWRAKLN